MTNSGACRPMRPPRSAPSEVPTRARGADRGSRRSRIRRRGARSLARSGEFRGDADARPKRSPRFWKKVTPSYFVEVGSGVRARPHPRCERVPAAAKCATKDSYLDTMRANALGGMAETRDERGIEVGREWCAYGRPPRARVAAIGALARFAKLNEEPSRRDRGFPDSAGRRSRVHGADPHPQRVRGNR